MRAHVDTGSNFGREVHAPFAAPIERQLQHLQLPVLVLFWTHDVICKLERYHEPLRILRLQGLGCPDIGWIDGFEAVALARDLMRCWNDKQEIS